MKINIYRADTAQNKLLDTNFLTQWQSLYKNCKWATGFQSPEYAASWYKTYSDKYQAVLLCAEDQQGQLSGLFTLALDEQRLFAAGDGQAEYQVWICQTSIAEQFMPAAIRALRAELPGHALELCYLPPQTPLSWIKRSLPGYYCYTKEFKSNILPLSDSDWIENYLRSKKRLKTKLNKLKRSGNVEFKRIQTQDELEPLMPELIALFDFRQGAVNGATPFRSNPLKKPFFYRLLNSGRLHITVITVDGRPVSGLMGVHGHGQVHLGEIVHSAFHSKYSPGTLHLWLLIQKLVEEGFSSFDLTPGGDAYKYRISNQYDVVHQLYFQDNLYSAILQSNKQFIKSRLKKHLPEKILSYLKRPGETSRQEPPEFKKEKYTWFKVRQTPNTFKDIAINKNNTMDLVCYYEKDKKKYLQYLSLTLSRIYQDQQVLTCVDEHKKLKAMMWLKTDETAENGLLLFDAWGEVNILEFCQFISSQAKNQDVYLGIHKSDKERLAECKVMQANDDLLLGDEEYGKAGVKLH